MRCPAIEGIETRLIPWAVISGNVRRMRCPAIEGIETLMPKRRSSVFSSLSSNALPRY